MTATTTASAPATTGADRVPSQGGIIDGSNPSEYNPKDPVTLFIIQAGLIIIVCHVLHWPLSKIRQPRVIAEVVGGIILGPSVMGHIPGFREAIFPEEALPNLTLVANIGLVLYLFMIGMETDVRFLVSNWRIASAVAFGGLALPFGLGCALAWGLYHQFSGDEGVEHIAFSTYLLFIGVAVAITAFPVLCRILTELNLLSTSAGLITLAAGVANDVIGWILLALCVALANASTGILALWILLTAFGFLLFILFIVKPCLNWVLRFTNSIDRGPSQSIVALIILMALASGFFTGIIGIHPIFGGFLVGLIIPRENGFTIKVTEKLEDLIGALFLPLYFTLSGLNTNLSLLNSGITWGYVFAVTFTAFFSKIIGASVAARLTGLVWRESFTVGTLMSCKGLVELIALNIGLQAKILSTRTFTIFVVMALLTTFATTPITTLLYPPWYQKKLAAWKRGEIDWDTGEPTGITSISSERADDGALSGPVTARIGQLLVYLRLDNLPATLNLLSLFGKSAEPASSAGYDNEKSGNVGNTKAPPAGRPAVKAHGLRLVQLGDRDSSVMTVAEVDEFTRTDPVVNTFRTVGQFLKVGVSGEVAVMSEQRFAEALVAKSSDISSDLLLLPWSETGNIGDSQALGPRTRLTSPYMSFAKAVLGSHQQPVAVYIPWSNPPEPPGTPSQERAKLLRAYSFSDIHRNIVPTAVTNMRHNIFFPFLGGEDDRYALGLVLQMCEMHAAVATIVHITSKGSAASDDDEFLNTVSSHLRAQVASRVEFGTAAATNAVEEIVTRSTAAIRADAKGITWHNLVVLGRRASANRGKMTDETQECLGLAAGRLLAGQIKADVLVVQANGSRA